MLQSVNKRETSVLKWTQDGALIDPIFTDCVKRYVDSYKHEMLHFTEILNGKNCTLSKSLDDPLNNYC